MELAQGNKQRRVKKYHLVSRKTKNSREEAESKEMPWGFCICRVIKLYGAPGPFVPCCQRPKNRQNMFSVELVMVLAMNYIRISYALLTIWGRGSSGLRSRIGIGKELG